MEFSRAERAEDAALVAGLAVGDEDSATAFVRRFQSRVFGLAVSITRDPGLGDGPEEQAERNDESARAIARLRTLPEDQARAVVLSLMGGCTAAEISAREQIPLGTAKTRIRSGLRRLRESMKEERRV